MSEHRFDHAAALQLYIALDPPNRTYARVAQEVGASQTSVRRWAKQERWDERLHEAEERGIRKALKTREKRVADVLALTDTLVDHFTANAAAKATEASFLDVERMVKLAELLTGEATDRVSLSEAQSFLQLVFQAALDWAGRDVPPGERRAGLKRAIDELVAGIGPEGGPG
jgi:hypothetical protein